MTGSTIGNSTVADSLQYGDGTWPRRSSTLHFVADASMQSDVCCCKIFQFSRWDGTKCSSLFNLKKTACSSAVRYVGSITCNRDDNYRSVENQCLRMRLPFTSSSFRTEMKVNRPSFQYWKNPHSVCNVLVTVSHICLVTYMTVKEQCRKQHSGCTRLEEETGKIGPQRLQSNELIL